MPQMPLGMPLLQNVIMWQHLPTSMKESIRPNSRHARQNVGRCWDVPSWDSEQDCPSGQEWGQIWIQRLAWAGVFSARTIKAKSSFMNSQTSIGISRRLSTSSERLCSIWLLDATLLRVVESWSKSWIPVDLVLLNWQSNLSQNIWLSVPKSEVPHIVQSISKN